jgi:hypothetical protein
MAPASEVEWNSVIPADVVAYATEKGLADSLLPHLEITRRVFPSARRLAVYLEDDPEIADLKFIVYEVEVPGLTVDQALEARHRCTGESISYKTVVPGCGIVLGLRFGK